MKKMAQIFIRKNCKRTFLYYYFLRYYLNDTSVIFAERTDEKEKKIDTKIDLDKGKGNLDVFPFTFIIF